MSQDDNWLMSSMSSCYRFSGKATESPEIYSLHERNLRRVNLEKFPYHFLFRIVDDTVRTFVITDGDRRLEFIDLEIRSECSRKK